MNKQSIKGQKMAECKHIWITGWKIPTYYESKRECLLCKKKQKMGYLGGSMWKWKDE